MCHRKQYVVPTRMHYDIYSKWENETPHFICSCAKEQDAINIMVALKARHIEAGAAWNKTTIKVRARPTVEHTIHSVRV